MERKSIFTRTNAHGGKIKDRKRTNDEGENKRIIPTRLQRKMVTKVKKKMMTRKRRTEKRMVATEETVVVTEAVGATEVIEMVEVTEGIRRVIEEVGEVVTAVEPKEVTRLMVEMKAERDVRRVQVR